MKQVLAISLDVHDRAHRGMIDTAYSLVGGDQRTYSEKHDRRVPDTQASLEHKMFSRIRGNDFTLEDVIEAVAIVRRRRDDLYVSKDVFRDPKLQEMFDQGVRANADKAVSLAEAFLNDLKTDIRRSA